ncbi:MAG: endopeptidase La, partial [Clostridium sp.]|nr:endopeptidase La [Clostridium sp.]
MESFTLDREMKLPGVPLRGLVMLPGELLHFDIAREESRRAVRAAEEKDSFVFLTTQKDSAKTTVKAEDVFSMGVICRIRQTVNMPGGMLRALVLGLCRARIKDAQYGSYTTVTVETIEDEPCNPLVAEALRRRIDSSFNDYLSVTTRINAETAENIRQLPSAGQYADAVANAVFVKSNMRQAALDAISVEERLKIVLAGVMGEVEITKLDKRIAAEVKRSMDQNQREYYLHEQIKAIRKELGETEQNEAEEYTRRLKEKCMLDLPWSEETKDDLDIEHARAILDNDHYGMEKVKQRILEHIAVARLTGKVNGQIICFVGPPGVGKTSIASSIARALGRNFVRMSLGGIHDEAEIRGHRRTYIGAMPGRVIAAMRQAGSINPLLLFDEIDKLTADMRGDPAAAMLEVLDSAQNFAFRDHFLEQEYDLSKVMFITTANDKDAIPRPLLDRMEVIELSGYLETEKVEIAKRHLIPKQLEKHGLKKCQLTIADEAIVELIRGYTHEAGVRELERETAAVCRKAAMGIGSGKTRVRVGKQKLAAYLGAPKYTHGAIDAINEIGLANGLAWTSFGGETLQIEVQIVPGSGQVILTGKLGDVMQESAKAALTFIKAHAEEFGITLPLDKKDIHLHVPEGAVPKDGPSAGITIMTAMLSALSGIPARADTAMTGEITLRGRVLEIGGLREKLLAAYRAGIKRVLIPRANEKDLSDVPDEVKA